MSSRFTLILAAALMSAPLWATESSGSDAPDQSNVLYTCRDTVTYTDVHRATITQSKKEVMLYVQPTEEFGPLGFGWTIDNNPSADDMSEESFESWSLNLPFVNIRENGSGTWRGRTIGSTMGLHGIYAGATIPCGAGADRFNTGWEIGMQQVVSADIPFRRGGTSLRIGAGLGWKKVHPGAGLTLAAHDGVLTAVPLPEGATDASASICTFHWTVPLLLVQPIGSHGFVVSAGGELHLNTYTTASASYSPEPGHSIRQKYKHLQQNLATVDVVGYVGFRSMAGIYVRWAPMRPWRAGFGPDYDTLSVGVMLGF